MLEHAPVTADSIRINGEIIALEAMTPSQLLQAIPKRLPGFVADVKSFVSDLLRPEANLYPLIDFVDTDRSISRLNYTSLAEVNAYVPAGMTATWEKYLDALEIGQNIVDHMSKETLKPTLSWLAKVLTDGDHAASIRPTHTAHGIVFHDLKKAKSAVEHCFSPSSTRVEQPYVSVFKRNQDYLEAVKRINDMSVRMAAINRKDLTDQVNEITGAMDKILIRLQANPNSFKVSGVTMKTMAELAMNLGFEIEFYSAHAYMVMAANQAMIDTSKKLKELSKR